MMDKPAVGDLGIDVAALVWRRSVAHDGYGFEIAFAGEWVLMRAVPGTPGGLVSLFSRHEWRCFLDGVANGEFDEAAAVSGAAAVGARVVSASAGTAVGAGSSAGVGSGVCVSLPGRTCRP
jgi:hypothetical protein